MESRTKFEKAVKAASDPAARIEIFGAMLARASGLGAKLVIAGGSAITIYSHGRWVSDDLDVVGDKAKIVPVLKGWGFGAIEDRDGRVYWSREDLALFVDIIDRAPGSGHGRSGHRRTIVTSQGPVQVSAIEGLIVRRLMFWSRNGRPALMDQAALLFESNRDEIDREYLESEVRYERVDDAYRELRRLTRADTASRDGAR